MSLPSTIQDRDFNNFEDRGDGTTNRFVTDTDGNETLEAIEAQTGIVASSSNSTTAALGSGASFIGPAEDIRQYAEATVNLYGAPTIAPGTLFFEYSPDGVNWDVSVPYALAGPQSFVPLPLRTVLPYFRVRYVNGGTALTAFRLTTVYHWQSAKTITRVINQTIDSNEPVENVRAFIGGQSPDGPFTNLPSSGMVSSQSTNAPLGIGVVFTSAIVSTTGFVAASVAVKSNVNSAANGLVFSFYADLAGTRLLKTSVFTYGGAPNGTAFQVPSIAGPYMRVTYTNGAVDQGTFELLTTLSVQAPPSDVLSISETINGNTAAQIIKASLVGQQENGIYANSKLSNSQSQMVAIADRPSEVRSRTRVIIPVNRTLVSGAGTTLYTVTVGKILYISAFTFSQTNDSASLGEWRLRDSTTIKSGFILPPRTGGTPASASSASPTLPEPMNFATNVNVILITGAVEIAGFLIGYEE
jgi:hypothetical protein